ncbi:Sec-independent protein translocase subunit TatA [Blastococcus sp. TF02A-35]|uniref:Sec-independent protein translocase subunit TatA n=1 Tax=Blastococcus sp. TF02A-35 TaxID=2559612 RepID=UPI0010741CD4|nr:Sec-independent protein translocase subunit TatA [Blastococcus sp. TF02A_35]TFV51627.1 Sec-independent protein translocase subunit TatA [Blastococcus sp. TF02A_35]
MGSLGPLEIGLIILAILLLFGYKKLPDASRSLGRSLRIFKGEMKGMKDDSAADGVRTKDAAQTSTPLRGEVLPAGTTGPASDDLSARLLDEAREAELRAAELRGRAEQARSADGSR